MSTTRTPSELRKAATDAGWESDPLAAEVLAKLDELDHTNAVALSKPSVPVWAWLAVIVAVGAGAGAIFQSIRLTETRAERQGYAAAKEAEIANLKAANVAQLEAVTGKLNSLVTAAEAVSKASATAADSNQAAVGLYMGKFQELLEDYKKAQDAGRAGPPSK